MWGPWEGKGLVVLTAKGGPDQIQVGLVLWFKYMWASSLFFFFFFLWVVFLLHFVVNQFSKAKYHVSTFVIRWMVIAML